MTQSYTPEEAEINAALEKSRKRALTPEEARLSLAQARVIGEIPQSGPYIGFDPVACPPTHADQSPLSRVVLSDYVPIRLAGQRGTSYGLGVRRRFPRSLPLGLSPGHATPT